MLTPATLRARREFLGYGIEELADLLQVDPRNVRRWEHGHRPIPDGVHDDVRDIEQQTRRTVDALAGAAEHTGRIDVDESFVESWHGRAILGRVLDIA